MVENYYPIEFNELGEFTIINSGTAPSPCIITIIPRVNLTSITITGLSKEPIVVNQINQDQTLVINGEDRTVTLDQNDYFEGYDGWEFPKVQPGVNEVTISNGQLLSAAVEYSTRYI